MAERKSNIELLRIMAMLLVVLVHANYLSLGGVEVADVVARPLPSFCKAFLEQLCIVCVNVFVLISGWFGIRPSLKGVLSLLFQVFFFHVLVVLLLIACRQPVSWLALIRLFYSDSPYWFVVAYLILYALSPVLNAFIETANRRVYATVLIAFFALEFAFGWISGASGAHYKEGYSAISFVGLYLLARFLSKYSKRLVALSVWRNVAYYLLFTLLPVLLFFLTRREFNCIAYSSPFVILASLFFFMAFNGMNISNSRVINYLACSSFSIYLVHMHPLVRDHFILFMGRAYDFFGGYVYPFFAVFFALLLGFVCIMADKIRLRIWNRIATSSCLPWMHAQMERIYALLRL